MFFAWGVKGQDLLDSGWPTHWAQRSLREVEVDEVEGVEDPVEGGVDEVVSVDVVEEVVLQSVLQCLLEAMRGK